MNDLAKEILKDHVKPIFNNLVSSIILLAIVPIIFGLCSPLEPVNETFELHPEGIEYDDKLEVEVFRPEINPVGVHLVINVGDPMSARG